MLSHFREHVEIIDAIGMHDVSRIVSHVEECAGRDPGPAPRAPYVGRRVSVLRAEGPDRLVLDPAGYLVVTPDRRRDLIALEHYGNDGVLRTVVEGKQAEDLAANRPPGEARYPTRSRGLHRPRADTCRDRPQRGQTVQPDRAPDETRHGRADAGLEDERGPCSGPCSCEEES